MQAIWLQALLLEGKNPSTNKSVIPEEVIRKVAFGVTVPRGTPYVDEFCLYSRVTSASVWGSVLTSILGRGRSCLLRYMEGASLAIPIEDTVCRLHDVRT